MTETPLQRAAKALATELSSGERSPEHWFIEGGLYSEEMLKETARAVLKAIREPSPEMLEGFGIHKERMKQNWQAMIDAALSD